MFIKYLVCIAVTLALIFYAIVLLRGDVLHIAWQRFANDNSTATPTFTEEVGTSATMPSKIYIAPSAFPAEVVTPAAMPSKISNNSKYSEVMVSSKRIATGNGDRFDMSDVLKGCGSVCDTSFTPAPTPGRYFDVIQKPIDCMALYSNEESDAPAIAWPPPQWKQLPALLKYNYTMNIKDMPVVPKYLKIRYSGKKAATSEWRASDIEKWKKMAIGGSLRGMRLTYTLGETERVMTFLKSREKTITGKRFFVIGSEKPWLEVLLLAFGAAHVTTIEYGQIWTDHPNLTTMTPADVRRRFVESGGAEPKFDGGATYSSLEHAGLGRYGDRLNPWGDLQAMAKAWCILKPQGPMYVGIPHSKVERIEFNAHRVYGPKRFPQIMANFLQTDAGTPPLFTRMGRPQNMVEFARGSSPANSPSA